MLFNTENEPDLGDNIFGNKSGECRESYYSPPSYKYEYSTLESLLQDKDVQAHIQKIIRHNIQKVSELQQQLLDMGNQWTSVEMELPDDDRQVLVKYVEYDCPEYFVGYYYRGNWYSSKEHLAQPRGWDAGTIDDDFKQHTVTAWKELE